MPPLWAILAVVGIVVLIVVAVLLGQNSDEKAPSTPNSTQAALESQATELAVLLQTQTAVAQGPTPTVTLDPTLATLQAQATQLAEMVQTQTAVAQVPTPIPTARVVSMPDENDSNALAEVPPGITNCATMEQGLIHELGYDQVSKANIGSEQYPIRYSSWVGDLCFGWASGGTGAKYIIMAGPAALQMGGNTGPTRMVRVPAGTTFTGWTQGGWRYTTDQALLAQWHGQGEADSGLICGYETAMGVAIPAFLWDGLSEVRDTSLDCKKTHTSP
jgi:hypothetical protein